MVTRRGGPKATGTVAAYVVMAVLVILPTACVPSSRFEQAAGGPGVDEPPRGPKTLTVAVQREPGLLLTFGLGQDGGGAANVRQMVNEFLVAQDDTGVFQPRLASESLSVGNGTWRIHPDGTMETIWKLRRSVKWHDGTAFTSADMMLLYDIYTDPNATSVGAVRPFLRGASAPDPLTFIMQWSIVTSEAARGGVAIASPVPRHLVGDVFYQSDRATFDGSSLLTTEFVGLGAYRLVRWERGSHFELAAFDDYYLGRPSIERIVVRIISDANTMVSNILAGAVDLVLPIGVDLDAALEVKRRWEGTGNQVRLDVTGRLQHVIIQLRPDHALPKNGFTQLPVRKAFLHAIDRATFADVMTHGLSPIADSWISPTDALRPEVEAAIPQFSYDPTQSQRLLAEAGWARGRDGVLIHNPSGERFKVELRGAQTYGAATERQLSVIGEGWKAIGADVELNIVPPARLDDREYQMLFPGTFLYVSIVFRFIVDNFHTRSIPSATNRWSGFNRGGYSNPAVDAALDRLHETIDARERLPLQRQLLQVQMGEVPFIPLHWEVVPVMMVKGVNVPASDQWGTHAWNVSRWDRE